MVSLDITTNGSLENYMKTCTLPLLLPPATTSLAGWKARMEQTLASGSPRRVAARSSPPPPVFHSSTCSRQVSEKLDSASELWPKLGGRGLNITVIQQLI